MNAWPCIHQYLVIDVTWRYKTPGMCRLFNNPLKARVMLVASIQLAALKNATLISYIIRANKVMHSHFVSFLMLYKLLRPGAIFAITRFEVISWLNGCICYATNTANMCVCFQSCCHKCF